MSALRTGIPFEFIKQLIIVGRHGVSGEDACRSLRPFDRYMVGTWNKWYPICDGLSIEDHIFMLKGLILNERHAGDFSIDSGSSAIWVYRGLEPRITLENCMQLAHWIIDNSHNPWLPFGNHVDKAYFIDNQKRFNCSFNGTLTQWIHTERGKDRFEKLQAEQIESLARKNAKRERAAARLERKILRDQQRYNHLKNGQSPPLEG